MTLNWSDWQPRNNRVALLVCLDTAMLLLVCTLEPIKLTGLEWHQCEAWLCALSTCVAPRGPPAMAMVCYSISSGGQIRRSACSRKRSAESDAVRPDGGSIVFRRTRFPAIHCARRGKFWTRSPLERSSRVVEFCIGRIRWVASRAELGLDSRCVAPPPTSATGQSHGYDRIRPWSPVLVKHFGRTFVLLLVATLAAGYGVFRHHGDATWMEPRRPPNPAAHHRDGRLFAQETTRPWAARRERVGRLFRIRGHPVNHSIGGGYRSLRFPPAFITGGCNHPRFGVPRFKLPACHFATCSPK